MVLKIGVIAEEQNDVDVLYELTCKVIPENNFSFSKFIGHGCGKLRRKCKAWSKNLILRGCSHLVVMHDLDDNNENRLRKELEKILVDTGFTGHLILIPIFEIEAWLLFDMLALKETFSMKRNPKVSQHPETIREPKKYLRDIVLNICNKHYINTIHNKRIANAISINKLSGCRSFSPYPHFLVNNLSS
jgi:hypothetical protein